MTRGTPAQTETCDILIRNGYVLTLDSERRVFPSGAVAIQGKNWSPDRRHSTASRHLPVDRRRERLPLIVRLQVFRVCPRSGNAGSRREAPTAARSRPYGHSVQTGVRLPPLCERLTPRRPRWAADLHGAMRSGRSNPVNASVLQKNVICSISVSRKDSTVMAWRTNTFGSSCQL